MNNPFQLGDAVVVATREYCSDPFAGHREGRITATAENSVRVRWAKRRLFKPAQQWVNIQDPYCQVEKTTDL
jgi:hypothetical protein